MGDQPMRINPLFVCSETQELRAELAELHISPAGEPFHGSITYVTRQSKIFNL